MKIYIAGPMRGYPHFNYPAFYAAAERLEAQGHEVFNPAAADKRRYGRDIGFNNPTGSLEQAERQHGFSIGATLAEDLQYICTEADAIYMLDGWAASRGATAELATAIAVNLPAYYESSGPALPPGETPEPSTPPAAKLGESPRPSSAAGTMRRVSTPRRPGSPLSRGSRFRTRPRWAPRH